MFTKSQTIWLAAAMLLGLVLRPTGGLTKPEKIEIRHFFGHWIGVSVSQDGLGSNPRMSPQDINVAIRRQDDGFRVCWTTPLPHGANDQTHSTPVPSIPWRFVFEPGSDKHTWQATETGNTLTTRRGVWASLRGRTLTIFGIITEEDGFSGLQIYDRTLDEFGMRLDFLRTDKDQALRSISGHLVRAEDLAGRVAHDPYEADPDEPKPREFRASDAPEPAEEFCAAA